MKAAITFIATLLALSAYSTEPDKAKQDSIIDTTIQAEDTIGTRKTLNDIRFDGWERKDWLDNEYIRTLRKYLDDYNSGKVSNTNLDPYKEQIKGQFVVYDINSYLLGGALIRITFLDMPDRVFSSWIYSNVDEKKETVESYEFRSISIEEERTDMTKEDILQAIKEMDGLKLWWWDILFVQSENNVGYEWNRIREKKSATEESLNEIAKSYRCVPIIDRSVVG